MAQAAARQAAVTDSEGLADARIRFLAAEPVAAHEVRGTIFASWQRSRDWNVAADRIDLNYLRDPDPEAPLSRCARPVLAHLHEQLDGQPISIVLTDASGLVMSRLTADHQLERHLDGVKLAPGFSYAEELVGTNGIGTALECGRPAHVFGHEHYAERLEGLACAGVPLHHPVSGKTVGVLDLTCWRRHADPLLVSLVKSTADQINQALLAGSNGRDVDLLREYARACRRTGGIVLALGNDILMMNDHARQILDPVDQSALINRATEVLAARRARVATIDLPSGAVARLHCKLVHDDSPFADGVVHVKLVEVPRQAPPKPSGKAAMSLPGLVGGGVLWQRACRDVEAAYDAGEWLALQGEAGVGKLAMARAVHQRRNPAGVFHVLDAAAATSNDWLVRMRRELLDAQGTVVIRHVDALGSRQLHAVSAALQEARAVQREQPLWAVITVTSGRPGADLTALLRLFPSTVELPPLRHHVEDLADLVPFFLAKLSQHGRLSCSPEAMQLLQRSKWPGNTEQLWQVLRSVIRRRRAGAIQPTDLPPECWSVSRRLLSPLESMERDAIVGALLDHEGNKLQAAESLGMSRATIYRKIHEYGIVTPSAKPGMS